MDSDFLVVGSGIAGLSFAIRVARFGKVVLITKKKDVDTATNLAQGGIAAVLDGCDEFENHVEDTIVSGAGLCDERVVEMVVRNGPGRIDDLVSLGVGFVKDENGGWDLGKEGGHSHRRVAHAYDLTGREIERALLSRLKKNKNVILLENHVAIDLLLKGESGEGEGGVKPECVGAYVLKPDGDVEVFTAKRTVLCTGGCGKVYLYTSNPDIATGDGVAMALRAGAEISNMEFIQFHPTCLYHPKAKHFLISEAVRGEGGVLVDGEGLPFMYKYDERRDLATRDSVARAIDHEMKETGEDNVFLDITHKDKKFLETRFPTIFQKCLSFGIDMSRDPIPVVPAAHYSCGGVVVDDNGCSSISGLLCLGETACTGLHGGNRLASNSLLEAVVFSKKAADVIEEEWPTLKDFNVGVVDEWKSGEAEPLDEEILINHNWDLIRRLMWNYVGIVRSERRLKLASKMLDEISQEIETHYNDYHVTDNMVELRNLSYIAQLIVHFAKLRKESRGLHYIKEYPFKVETERKTNRVKRDLNGENKWRLSNL